MNILFQSSEKFEKDIKSFQTKEREKIISKINFYCSDLNSNGKLFYQHAYRPFKVILPNDFGSSLYVLRITSDIRVILTQDEDPLFDQVIVTLLRVVRQNSLEKAFKGMAESLYQENINFDQGDQNG